MCCIPCFVRTPTYIHHPASAPTISQGNAGKNSVRKVVSALPLHWSECLQHFLNQVLDTNSGAIVLAMWLISIVNTVQITQPYTHYVYSLYFAATSLSHLRASAHERFFAAAVKQPQRPIISWLCARRRKKRTFCSRSGAVSVCATQARGICSVAACFTTIL